MKIEQKAAIEASIQAFQDKKTMILRNKQISDDQSGKLQAQIDEVDTNIEQLQSLIA